MHAKNLEVGSVVEGQSDIDTSALIDSLCLRRRYRAIARANRTYIANLEDTDTRVPLAKIEFGHPARITKRVAVIVSATCPEEMVAISDAGGSTDLKSLAALPRRVVVEFERREPGK